MISSVTNIANETIIITILYTSKNASISFEKIFNSFSSPLRTLANHLTHLHFSRVNTYFHTNSKMRSTVNVLRSQSVIFHW